MSEKSIPYLNRTFDDYKQSLIELSKKYYPDLTIDYNDASVASWLLDINAAIADSLNYHIDRTYQETNIDSAQEKESLYSLARNNGVKIPGPKGAMAEVKFTCSLPINGMNPDYSFAPIIKRGTKVTAGAQVFELLTDVDFQEQFDEDGNSNRTITPMLNNNGLIVQYKISKLATVIAGESKIYKKVIYSKDVTPFMEVLLPEKNIMNVESVITVNSPNVVNTPTYGAFYSYDETVCSGTSAITRFYEVDSLSQQYRWGEVADGENGKAKIMKYGYTVDGVTYPVYCVTKGEWKDLKHKFITEYTNNGYMKLIFGAGIDSSVDSVDISDAATFSKFQIERIIKNESLGYLPNPNTTMFILYRVGGGKASNVAKGAINYISYLNLEMRGSNTTVSNAIKKSIAVESTTPSVSGKDMLNENELKYLIKYNNGSQERCVTTKDYLHRILMLPAKYGSPFRVGVNEENNKIMVYLLGVDYEGHLDSVLPTLLIENITNYLSKYRMINDFVEIKSGKIINLSFDVDVFIDKNYNKSDVVSNIITTISDYMDINKHDMGDDIFVGDIQKEISKIDGVINVINIDIWNEYDSSDGYSSSKISQEVTDDTGKKAKIDLDASDGVIYCNGDSMLEVKNNAVDIGIRVKSR